MHPPARLLLLLGLLFSAAPAAARRYTLAELVAQVGQSYVGVAAAKQGSDAADAQLAQAHRLWWPTGNLTFGLTGSPEVRCVDPVTGYPWNDPAHPGDRGRAQQGCLRTDVVDLRSGDKVLPVHGVAFNLGINLVQPLYTFGKIEAASRAAQAGVRVAAAQVDKDRGEVTFNATRAYWLLKWARAAAATLDDAMGRLKSWISKIDDEIDKGKSSYTENDLVRLKLALDTAELGKVDLDKARELALAGLRTLTADPEADIDDGELEVAELAEAPLSYYEEAALLHRPEARMLEAGQRATGANRELQRANLLPDLGLALSFNYGYAQSVDDPQNAFMNHPNSLGLGLALVLRYSLDVPLRLASFAKARAEAQGVELRRQQALGGIAVELQGAWLEARAAKRRAELLAHSEKVARGWFNAVDQNLQLGIADSRDLVDGARNFFELRMRHLQALMDVNMAVAGLKQAAGILATP